jgi:hypothetical protein
MRKATEHLRTTCTRDILLPIRVAACRSVLLSGTCRLVGHWCVATQQFVHCADVFWCWNVMMCLNKCSKLSVGPWLDCNPTRSPGADSLSRGLLAAALCFARIYTFLMAVTSTWLFPSTEPSELRCSSSPQYLFISCTVYNSNQLVCRQNCEAWLLASSCLSVRMQQLHSHWKDFHNI